MRLFATAAAGLWAGQQIPAKALLQTFQRASGTGGALNRVTPLSQEDVVPAPPLPLFPLRLVLLPRANLALHIFEERYKEMIADCLQNQWEFGILLVGEESVEDIGCTAAISEVVRKYPDGRMDILVQGRRRFEISMLDQERPYLRGKPLYVDDDTSEAPAEAVRQQAIRLYDQLVKSVEADDPPTQEPSDEPGPQLNDEQLSYRIMAELPAELVWKQDLLELRSESERLARVIRYLQQWIDYLERNPDQPAPANTV